MAFLVEPGSWQSQEMGQLSPKARCHLTAYARICTQCADVFPKSIRTRIQQAVQIQPGMAVCQRHPNNAWCLSLTTRSGPSGLQVSKPYSGLTFCPQRYAAPLAGTRQDPEAAALRVRLQRENCGQTRLAPHHLGLQNCGIPPSSPTLPSTNRTVFTSEPDGCAQWLRTREDARRPGPLTAAGQFPL